MKRVITAPPLLSPESRTQLGKCVANGELIEAAPFRLHSVVVVVLVHGRIDRCTPAKENARACACAYDTSATHSHGAHSKGRTNARTHARTHHQIISLHMSTAHQTTSTKLNRHHQQQHQHRHRPTEHRASASPRHARTDPTSMHGSPTVDARCGRASARGERLFNSNDYC